MANLLGGALDQWQEGSLSTTVPVTTNILRSVAYGNGMFVAVGDAGTLLSSPGPSHPAGLVSWQTQNSMASQSLKGVTFANGLFVVVGAGGVILTSPDGTRWTARASATSNDLAAVGYGNGQFVSVGSAGTILTSTDGISWANHGLNVFSLFLGGVTWGNNLWVTVGSQGTIATSSDGIAWAPRNSHTAVYLASVAYGAGLYLAVGDNGTTVSSTDGVNWASTQNLSGAQHSIIFQSNLFVATGETRQFNGGSVANISASTNGTSWTGPLVGLGSPPPENLYGITYGNGWFVAVGDSPLALTSSDGLNWPNIFAGSSSGVTYGNQLFLVTIGTGVVFTSPDALAWNPHDSGQSNALHASAWGSSNWVSVGDSGRILTSADAATWKSAASGVSAGLLDVAHGANTFVAVGTGGTILVSTNGDVWSRATSPVSSDYEKVIFGNDRFLASSGGTIVTSSDGAAWTVRRSGAEGENFANLAFGNGIFLAGGFVFLPPQGPKPLLSTSTDGTNWVSRFDIGEQLIAATAFGNGTFVLEGLQEGGYFPTLYTSTDTVSWTLRTTLPQRVFASDLAYGSGRFVGARYDGLIVYSGTISAPQLNGRLLPSIGGFQLTISGGNIGQIFRVQTASGLTGWSDWLAFTNSGNRTTLLDTSATNAASRFYRAISP